MKIKEGTKSSQYIGVCWNDKDQIWQAYIGYKGAKLYLGIHKNERDAALAYDKARIKQGLEPVNILKKRA